MIKIRVAGFFLMLAGQIYLAKLGVLMIDRFIVLLSFGIGSLMFTEGMKWEHYYLSPQQYWLQMFYSYYS